MEQTAKIGTEVFFSKPAEFDRKFDENPKNAMKSKTGEFQNRIGL
jgi:hypothetical protein